MRWGATARTGASRSITTLPNARRCVALGRKNFLFASSEAGGARAAAFYSLIGTATLNGHNPEAFLREILTRISEHPISGIAELLPWNMKPELPVSNAREVGAKPALSASV